jgi:hypothetical protein
MVSRCFYICEIEPIAGMARIAPVSTKTNSEKIGYQKRERKSEAVEMTA